IFKRSSSLKFKASSSVAASLRESLGGTRKPASPTTSFTPPQSVATTTRLQAIASATTNPKPSQAEDNVKTSAADINDGMSVLSPRKLTLLFRPSEFAYSFSSLSGGPSPTIASLIFRDLREICD